MESQKWYARCSTRGSTERYQDCLGVLSSYQIENTSLAAREVGSNFSQILTCFFFYNTGSSKYQPLNVISFSNNTKSIRKVGLELYPILARLNFVAMLRISNTPLRMTSAKILSKIIERSSFF